MSTGHCAVCGASKEMEQLTTCQGCGRKYCQECKSTTTMQNYCKDCQT